MSDANSVNRPAGEPRPEASDFKALISWHIENGTCYICEKSVEHSQGYHGATGAHWDCIKHEETQTKEAFARVDAGFRSIGIKPKRKPEGEGSTAQKCKAMAVAAIEEALGAKLYDITIWNQKGVYRGPRWDLDVWGMAFWFDRDGHRFSGSASSLATMSQCVKFKKLRAVEEACTFSFSLCPTTPLPNVQDDRGPQ